MKTFVSEGLTIEVPDINIVSDDGPVMQIAEGEHAGVCFKISNIRMDDADEGLMWYDLNITDAIGQNTGLSVDNIKPIADNFILMALHEQIKRAKNETAPDI